MTSEVAPPIRFARRLLGSGDRHRAALGRSMIWRDHVGLGRHTEVGLNGTQREPKDRRDEFVHNRSSLAGVPGGPGRISTRAFLHKGYARRAASMPVKSRSPSGPYMKSVAPVPPSSYAVFCLKKKKYIVL